MSDQGNPAYCRRTGFATTGFTGQYLQCSVLRGSTWTTYQSPNEDWGYDYGVAWVSDQGNPAYCRLVGTVTTNQHLLCTVFDGTNWTDRLSPAGEDWGYSTGWAWTTDLGNPTYCRQVGFATSYQQLACTVLNGSTWTTSTSQAGQDWGYDTKLAWVGTVAASSNEPGNGGGGAGTAPGGKTPSVATLRVNTSHLAGGVKGKKYSATLEHTGGTAKVTWKLSAGKLPAGLKISALGAIKGIPTKAGTAKFTVKATDAAEHTAIKSLSIAVVLPLKHATPKIGGTLKVGKTLAAKPGSWTTGAKFAYQWYANGKAIKKATKAKLVLTKALKGKTITVVVTGKLKGYATVSLRSKTTKKVA